MTIYSRHPNRGKVQILATYRGREKDVVSSTVTSVDDVAVAALIVDALNRISACATVSISTWDARGDRMAYYPSEHLAALTDRSARSTLPHGVHSLWYGYVNLLLHHALTDLDDAVADVPAPVQMAIAAELEAEERALRAALAEYSEGTEPSDTEAVRDWDFGSPFILFNGGEDGLGSEDRERLNRFEEGATAEQIKKGVADMRCLFEVSRRSTNDNLWLLDEFTITDDPLGEGRYYLNVEAPLPNNAHGRDEWTIDLGRWDVDLDDPANEGGTASGESVLQCVQNSAPSVADIVELLNRSGGRQEQLAAWAVTPVGQPLEGTAFVVTRRFEDSASAAADDSRFHDLSDGEPKFAELFRVCRCGTDECPDCSGFQITPRTADALYSAASVLGDHGYDDVAQHGDDSVGEAETWALFDEYPRITWRQNAAWRRQAARSFDDLCEDLAAGKWPHPRCPAEEMAIHLVLNLAKAGIEDEWLPLAKESVAVPEHEDDFDWDMVGEVLLQDVDILSLFDIELDGIEDPDSELNRYMAMGDYRPQAWFDNFNNMPPRGGSRPFRR